jgi:hypothetical protein
MRAKKCKQCKLTFHPTKPLQYVCGWECAIAYANKLTTKNFNQDIRRRKTELKTKAQWLKEAQIEFNRFIRQRDAADPCISCGRFHTGQYHAGHYRSIGSAPHLRFNEYNVQKQCSACNNHLSGNIINYRINLITKIGLAQVERIEADNEAKHYTIDDIIAIKKHYQAKVKELSQ